jgi:hypothetical protein
MAYCPDTLPDIYAAAAQYVNDHASLNSLYHAIQSRYEVARSIPGAPSSKFNLLRTIVIILARKLLRRT